MGKYPDGVRPGDQLGGSAAEFFRYRPLTIANKIKCEVCEAVLWYLVPSMKSFDEESVADVLDGDYHDDNLPIEDAGDKQSGVLKKALVGCNRFFKYVLREGYKVKKCTDETQAAEQEHCFELTDAIPSMRDLETYSMDKEAVYAHAKALSRRTRMTSWKPSWSTRRKGRRGRKASRRSAAARPSARNARR